MRSAPVVIFSLLAATAAAESRPKYGGAMEGGLLGAPVTFDPPAALTHAEVTVVSLVFDTLYELGADGVPQPHLALALPVVEPTRVRIALRKGVRFHDGSEMTPADVVASLERVRTTPARWALAAVSSIKADADGIELALKAATPDLAALLSLPATAVTRGGKPALEKPVGSGPFFVESVDRGGKRLALRAFENHFAGRPYIDTLSLRWFDTPDAEARRYEQGTAQMSARGDAVFAAAQPKFKGRALEGPAALLVFVGFGRKHADVTAERKFRRALDLALARGAVASVSSGERVTPARVPLPVEAGGPVLDAAGRADDLPGARAALAEAATRVRSLANVASLQLEILVEDTRPDDREIAERVARALTKLGIDSAITSVTAAQLRDRVKRGDCDLYIGQLTAPITSKAAWWGAAFAAGGELWAEQRLATGAVDPAEATRAFADRLPILPLVFRSVRLWHRTDVRGLGFDAAGRPGLADLFYFGGPARSAAGKQ